MWQFQYDGLTTQMRLVTPDLPGRAGHLSAVEAPDDFNDAVCEFVLRRG